MKKPALIIAGLSLAFASVIYFSRVREYQQYQLLPTSDQSRSYQVNINLANAREFINLPGIGPKLAQEILDYRKELGGFKSINDLKRVSGIGSKKFQSIKEYLTLEVI